MRAITKAAGGREDAATSVAKNAPASPIKTQCAAGTPAKPPASSGAANVGVGHKDADEREQEQTRKEVVSRVEAMLKTIREKVDTSESNLVCIPRETFEALQEEIAKENAVFCLPPLYDLPGYPGVRGNFDGLWHIWLAQRAHELQLASALKDAEAGAESGPGIVCSKELQNGAGSAAVTLQTPHTATPAMACGSAPSAFRVCLRNSESGSARLITEASRGHPSQSGCPAVGYDVVGMRNREETRAEQALDDGTGLRAPSIAGGPVKGLEAGALDSAPVTSDDTHLLLPHGLELKNAEAERSLRDRAMLGPEPHRAFDIFWERMKDNEIAGWHY